MAGPKKRFRLATMIFSVVVALVAVEIGARLLFQVRHHRLSPENFPWMEITAAGPRLAANTHAEIVARINGRSIWLDINSQGFRGPELEAAKPRPRLLLLGDSVMFGPGLDERETVPGRLRRLLPGVEVVNAAVPGLGTKEEAELLEQKWGAVQPDLVVVGFYMNDARRSVILEEQYGDMPDALAGLITTLRRHSVAWNELWARVLTAGLIRSGKLSADWVEPWNGNRWIADRAVYDQILKLAADDFGAAWQDDTWPGIERELGRIAQTCASRGARAAIVVFPVALQVGAQDGDTLPQRKLAEIGGRLNMPVLDPLPALRARNDKRLFYDQCHFTPLGAELVAAELASFIETRRLIGR